MDEGIIHMNAARKQHKHFSRELLADTIVTKAVELEVSRRANVLPNHTLVQTAHFHTTLYVHNHCSSYAVCMYVCR